MYNCKSYGLMKGSLHQGFRKKKEAYITREILADIEGVKKVGHLPIKVLSRVKAGQEWDLISYKLPGSKNWATWESWSLNHDAKAPDAGHSYRRQCWSFCHETDYRSWYWPCCVSVLLWFNHSLMAICFLSLGCECLLCVIIY